MDDLLPVCSLTSPEVSFLVTRKIELCPGIDE
jgi:hypothetical protein